MALSDKLQQIGANAEEIGAEVDALLAFANETTGAGDTRLGDALRTLAEGYGEGTLTVTRGVYTLTSASAPVVAALDHEPVTPLLFRARLVNQPASMTGNAGHTITAIFSGDNVSAYIDRSSSSVWQSNATGYPWQSQVSARRAIVGQEVRVTLFPIANSYTGLWAWEVIEGLPITLL